MSEIPIISPEILRIINSTPSWPAMTCTNEEAKPVDLEELKKASEGSKISTFDMYFNMVYCPAPKLKADDPGKELVMQFWYDRSPIIKEPQAVLCDSDPFTHEELREIMQESKDRIETEIMFKVAVGEHFIKRYLGDDK